MIDGLKATISNNLSALRAILDFKQPCIVNTKTGEVEEENKYPIAKYKCLTLEDKNSNIELFGSIHKLYNDGKHNYNRFGLSEIHKVLYELAVNLKLNISKVRLSNLEFGVNLIVDFEPKKFLSSLLIHKGKIFTWQMKNNLQYRECEHIQYFIKIYDKGLQYGLNRYVLRIELKFIKMEKINGFGIKYLSDLLNPQKLEKLKYELLRVYDEILIGDLYGSTEELKEKDKIFLANGLNGNYWLLKLPKVTDYEFDDSDKTYKRDIKKYQREVLRFKNLLTVTGSNNRALKVRKMIKEECEYLINEADRITNSLKKCPELTGVKQLNSLKKCPELTGTNFVEENRKLSRNDRLLYSVKNGHKKNSSKHKCLVTGYDISMQKEESKFLCSTGLKYYKENHPEIWLKLWKRLDSKWHGCSEEIQINEIHHSIRNEYNNPYHNARRGIKKLMKYPALFDQMKLIDQEKLRVAGMTS